MLFKLGQYHTRFALRKFPDGNFAWARPRGFCLSGFALKQKHRSGLQILTRIKQFARLLPLKKHLLPGVFLKFGQYRIWTCDLPREADALPLRQLPWKQIQSLQIYFVSWLLSSGPRSGRTYVTSTAPTALKTNQISTNLLRQLASFARSAKRTNLCH